MSASNSKEPDYLIRWNNHSSTLFRAFIGLYRRGHLTDVTLACDGHYIKCHKIVLAACSLYFEQVLQDNQCAHPIIYLKDIALQEIQNILEFMYSGQVNIPRSQVASMMKVAEDLQVRGIVPEEAETSELFSSEPSRSFFAPTTSSSASFPENSELGIPSSLFYPDVDLQPPSLGSAPPLRNFGLLPPSLNYLPPSFGGTSANMNQKSKPNGEGSVKGKNKGGSSKQYEERKGEGESKSYKLYPKSHMDAAIEAVKDKSMSALKAAKKFKIPSRTIYCKLKQMENSGNPNTGKKITMMRRPDQSANYSATMVQSEYEQAFGKINQGKVQADSSVEAPAVPLKVKVSMMDSQAQGCSGEKQEILLVPIITKKEVI